MSAMQFGTCTPPVFGSVVANHANYISTIVKSDGNVKTPTDVAVLFPGTTPVKPAIFPCPAIVPGRKCICVPVYGFPCSFSLGQPFDASMYSHDQLKEIEAGLTAELEKIELEKKAQVPEVSEPAVIEYDDPEIVPLEMDLFPVVYDDPEVVAPEWHPENKSVVNNQVPVGFSFYQLPVAAYTFRDDVDDVETSGGAVAMPEVLVDVLDDDVEVEGVGGGEKNFPDDNRVQVDDVGFIPDDGGGKNESGYERGKRSPWLFSVSAEIAACLNFTIFGRTFSIDSFVGRWLDIDLENFSYAASERAYSRLNFWDFFELAENIYFKYVLSLPDMLKLDFLRAIRLNYDYGVYLRYSEFSPWFEKPGEIFGSISIDLFKIKVWIEKIVDFLSPIFKDVMQTFGKFSVFLKRMVVLMALVKPAAASSVDSGGTVSNSNAFVFLLLCYFVYTVKRISTLSSAQLYGKIGLLVIYGFSLWCGFAAFVHKLFFGFLDAIILRPTIGIGVVSHQCVVFGDKLVHHALVFVSCVCLVFFRRFICYPIAVVLPMFYGIVAGLYRSIGVTLTDYGGCLDTWMVIGWRFFALSVIFNVFLHSSTAIKGVSFEMIVAFMVMLILV